MDIRVLRLAVLGAAASGLVVLLATWRPHIDQLAAAIRDRKQAKQPRAR